MIKIILNRCSMKPNFSKLFICSNWVVFFELFYYCEHKKIKIIYLFLFVGENFNSILELKNNILSNELLEHLARNQKFSFLLQSCFELVSSF